MLRFKWWGRHPSYELLSEFFDGPESRLRRRVARHLEACTRCRREVGVMRDVENAVREIPVPQMAPDLFDRVLASRASGTVTPLLPEGPLPRENRRRGALVKALGLVLLTALGAAFLLRAREAAADASSLEISHATDDRTFELSYAPAPRFEPRDPLSARVWSWTGTVDGGWEPALESVVLRRTGSSFTGVVQLPPGGSYALLAVESPDGRWLDVKGGEFWELGLESTAERHIAELKALETLATLGFRPSSSLAEVARRAVDRYPEEPTLWFLRAAYELRLAGDERTRDSLLLFHQSQLRRLEVIAARRNHDVPALIHYARTLGSDVTSRRLIDLLEETDPDHRLVAEHRTIELLRTHMDEDDLPGWLAGVEDEWRRSGPANEFLLRNGFGVAERTGDSEALRRWAEREFEWLPETRDHLAQEAARIPSLRDWGMERLRERIRFHQTALDSYRPIYQTRAEYAVRSSRVEGRLRSSLGKALIATGEVQSGIEMLKQSLDLVWDPETAGTLLDYLPDESGAPETAQARRFVRRLVNADPIASGTLNPPARSRALEASGELLARLTEAAPSGHLGSEEVRLRARQADAKSGGAALDPNSVTLLGLWQAVPRAAVDEALEDFPTLLPLLDQAGVRLIFAGPEWWIARLSEVGEGLGAEVYIDAGGTATEAFGGWCSREYVVISDGTYSVHYDAHDAVRVALLLAGQRKARED